MNIGGWVIGYLLVTVLIGLAAGRLVHSSSDFLSSGRRLPFVLSSFALFAFWFGSETILGATSEFIQHGILGVIEDPFGAFLCLILFAAFFVKKLYRRNLLTLGDLFRQAYGPKVERLASALMILSFFGYVAAQIIALSILFQAVFGLDLVTGKILSAAIVTAYTATGGMWSVSITDFVQSIVILVGLVILCVFLTGKVEATSLFQSPNPYFFDWYPTAANGHRWADYLAAWCAIGLGSLASQDIFQRANAARNERTAVYSTYAGAFIYLLFAMLPLYLGLLVFHLQPQLIAENPQTAMPEMIARMAPAWLQVIFYGALISAIFSTCSGAMLAPASLLAENLVRPLLKNPTDRQFLFLSRLCVLVVAIGATWLAISSESIYDLVAQSSILGLVCILVPMWAALYRQQTSSLAAILSMVLGLAVYLLAEYAGLWPPVPSLFTGLFASISGLALGEWLHSRMR